MESSSPGLLKNGKINLCMSTGIRENNQNKVNTQLWDTLYIYIYHIYIYIYIISISAESLSPALHHSVSGGSWVAGRGGELVITPGAALTLDCVFSRTR